MTNNKIDRERKKDKRNSMMDWMFDTSIDHGPLIYRERDGRVPLENNSNMHFACFRYQKSI